MWISPEFKIYLVKEFRRLKEDVNRRLSLAWNLNRTLSKLNYRIHTDAVKAHLIPALVTPAQAAITYATEADLLNVALFGHTARQWRDANPTLEGNVRDYASVEQLLVLANMEGMNAEFIHMGLLAGRAAQAVEPNCHSSDASSDFHEPEGVVWPEGKIIPGRISLVQRSLRLKAKRRAVVMRQLLSQRDVARVSTSTLRLR